MVNLVHLKNELKKIFTLRSDKDTVWSNYLKEDTEYVNGSLYIYNEAPNYFSQKLSSVNFLGYDNDNVDLIVYSNNTIHEYQVKQSTVTASNGVNIEVSNKEFFDDKLDKVSLRIPYSVNGKIRVDVPSLNFEREEYSGIAFNLTVINQNNTNITNYNQTNNTVSLRVNVPVKHENQTITLQTFYRNKDVDATVRTTIGNATYKNMSITRNSSDVGVRVIVNPYTFDNKNFYTGYWTEIYF